MSRGQLHVTSNVRDLDPAQFLRGFAGFLTGAVSDGSFVITPREESDDGEASGELLTEPGSTATIRMTGDGQKGDYE